MRDSGNRASPRGGRSWPWTRLRLRHKLSFSLVIAALLPVLVASWVAVSVVLRGLDRGLRDETHRQLDVGINLVLRNVQRLAQEAVRLSSSSDLLWAMAEGPMAIADALARESPHLTSSLVQVANERGEIQAQRVVGEVTRFSGLEAGPQSRALAAGRTYERSVTIVTVGEQLVVRAAAPIVDASFKLRGVIVMSLPLDGDFADGIKSSLGADVLIFAHTIRGTTARTTFLDPIGRRVTDINVDRAISQRIQAGRSAVAERTVADRDYALGYAPLLDLDGRIVGTFAIAVDRVELLSARTTATRSLALGAAGAFVFALGLAGLLSRRITRPLSRLHEGAIAIARGDLEHRIAVAEGDEIGDLAQAFAQMTSALKENQRRLAARMREIVALHDAGRAVSSVLELDQVLKKIVDSVARVFHVRVCALWLVTNLDAPVDSRKLLLGAARARRSDMRLIVRTDEVSTLVQPLAEIASDVALRRETVRIDRIAEAEAYKTAAIAAGVTGSLLATPLERKGKVLGIIVIGRTDDARPFGEADASLLATFADQAATTVENAQLYAEVRAWSEELEAKVRLRTQELMAINSQLATTIRELRETQAQLVLSERLAGLGQLVAGVAHEINSPSAAIRGTVDTLGETVARLIELSRQLAAAPLSADDRERVAQICAAVSTERGLASPVAVRRAARSLRERLEVAGLSEPAAVDVARALTDAGLDDEQVERVAVVLHDDQSARAVAGYLKEYVALHRSAHTIDSAIRRIQRIVGGLRSYSHLDQAASRVEADIHEGIESTLVLFDHLLARGIRLTRNYAVLPRVPIFVDELNQVWTNLIHNAVQALDGQGAITIETERSSEGVAVRIIDDGPGIPPDVMPRIFEPFYTTKKKGEGSGLGLGIVRQIVDKHGGRVAAESSPGRTCFEVWLPADVARGVTASDSSEETSA